jgi:Fe-S-cluster containining protein
MVSDMSMEPKTTGAEDGAVITCASCKALCCRLEVMIMGEDDVPCELTEVDRWGGQVMARLSDGWCVALDRGAMLCRVYERRPTICRDYQVGGSECIAERQEADSRNGEELFGTTALTGDARHL